MKKILLLLLCTATLTNAATQTKTLASQPSTEITQQEWEATQQTAIKASKWAGWKAVQAPAITAGAYVGGYCGYRFFKGRERSFLRDFASGNVGHWEREALFQGIGGVAGLQALEPGQALLKRAYTKLKPYIPTLPIK